MPHVIELHLDGDGAWEDLADRGVINLMDEAPWRLVALEHGMSGGGAALALRLDLPDGNAVVAHTSVRSFLTVAAALRARFPEG